MACPQPLPSISCPMCTYFNADNATQCELCNTVFKQSFPSEIMEQNDDDCPFEEDEDEDEDDMMDLTEYEDDKINKNASNMNQFYNDQEETFYDSKYDFLFKDFMIQNHNVKKRILSPLNTASDAFSANTAHTKNQQRKKKLKAQHPSEPSTKRRKLNNNKKAQNRNEYKEEAKDIEDDDVSFSIKKAYHKFIEYYFCGEYCLDTLCIEMHSTLKKQTKKFDQLSILGRLITPNINNTQPPYSIRFKHRKVNLKKIDKSGDDHVLYNEFLKRVLSADEYIYSDYTLIILNKNTYIDIHDNDRYNEYFESFDDMIDQLQNSDQLKDGDQLQNSICIAIDGDQLQNSDQLKDKMILYTLFRDANIHIMFPIHGTDKRNTNEKKDKMVEFVERIAYSMAKKRFEDIEIQPLRKTLGHTYTHSNGRHTNKDVFIARLKDINRVEDHIANNIARIYPTFGYFRAQIKKQRANHPELLLSRTVRGIGNSLSIAIYNDLFDANSL